MELKKLLKLYPDFLFWKKHWKGTKILTLTERQRTKHFTQGTLNSCHNEGSSVDSASVQGIALQISAPNAGGKACTPLKENILKPLIALYESIASSTKCHSLIINLSMMGLM